MGKNNGGLTRRVEGLLAQQTKAKAARKEVKAAAKAANKAANAPQPKARRSQATGGGKEPLQGGDGGLTQTCCTLPGRWG